MHSFAWALWHIVVHYSNNCMLVVMYIDFNYMINNQFLFTFNMRYAKTYVLFFIFGLISKNSSNIAIYIQCSCSFARYHGRRRCLRRQLEKSLCTRRYRWAMTFNSICKISRCDTFTSTSFATIQYNKAHKLFVRWLLDTYNHIESSVFNIKFECVAW